MLAAFLLLGMLPQAAFATEVDTGVTVPGEAVQPAGEELAASDEAAVLKETETTSEHLEGFSFSLQGNGRDEGLQVVKSEEGMYTLYIPSHGICQGAYALHIAAGDSVVGDFRVTYRAFRDTDHEPDYEGTELTVTPNEDGVVELSDYYRFLGTEDRQPLYTQEIVLQVGSGDGAKTYQLYVKPYCELESFLIQETAGNKQRRPIRKDSETDYATTVLRGSEVKITVHGGIEASTFQNRTIYIDEEPVNQITYTAGDESEKVIAIRIRDDYYGFEERTYRLTIKVLDADHFPVLKSYTKISTIMEHTQFDELVLTMETENTDENTTYAWKLGGKPTGENSPSYTVDTSKAAQHNIQCTVSNTVDGFTYSSRSGLIIVKIQAFVVNQPEILTQPKPAEYMAGMAAEPLTVEIDELFRVNYFYQWYSNTVESNESGTPIEGATGKSYVPSTGTPGTTWYYCVVHATYQDLTSEACVSDCAKVQVNELTLSMKGEGSAQRPYLIENADHLAEIRRIVDGGITFADVHFQFANDITLPTDWTPIGSTKNGVDSSDRGPNMNPFSGILDGNHFTVNIPEGGLPLFNYVREATIRNLNIYGPKIAGYGLVNKYVVDYGTDGNYATGVPETVTIDHCCLKKGSATLYSGFIGGYASGANTVYIRNCTVEEGVVIGYPLEEEPEYDRHRFYLGSLASEFNGVVTNCTSAATVNGTTVAGGLVAAKGQSMGLFVVENSSFTGTVASGEIVGGIVGAGYNCPNSPCVTIHNCYVSADITGSKRVGGIFSGEAGVVQCWGNGIGGIQDNVFCGTIHATSEDACVGGVIAQVYSLNKYNNIENNYYLEGCGAAKGIGFVQYVDTSAEHETESGAIYFNTGEGLPDISGVTKEGLNRTDDPLGKDAGKLTRATTEEEFQNGTVVELLNNSESSLHNWIQGEKCPVHSSAPIVYELTVSGEYKTTYLMGEELDLSGAVFAAKWSDGTVTNPTLEELTITGYDSSVRGQQTVKIRFGAATLELQVTVLKPAGENITVTFTLLGDTLHGETGEVHTRMQGNLETWVAETAYTVDVNATVKDVLELALKENGMTCSNPSGNYVESITRNGVTLGEFDNGSSSGWMYTLNGVYPSLGVSQQYLEGGDVIVFHYTDDYNVDWTTTEDPAVTAVIGLIDAIGTPVTLESEKAIVAAREAYDKLTEGQKLLVKNYETLTAVEAALAELKKTDEDQAAADRVKDLIDAIGAVTLDSEKAIKAARAAYDALTDLQKKLVTNYQKLVDAESALAYLKKPHADAAAAYKSTGDYLTALGKEHTPTVGSVGGEWMVLGLARSGRAVPAGYYGNVVSYVEKKIDRQGRLHSSKSTDNSRLILALTAMGKDVTNVGGHNLLQGLTDMKYVKKQGINGPIWALIALDSHSYEIPTAVSGADPVTRQKLIDTILAGQLSDGGWTISGQIADADMTGMAIQALAPYCKTQEKVRSAVDQALQTLSKLQQGDGGFYTLDPNGNPYSNSESCAQVVVALTALGLDPHTDSRFIKNGHSVVDALCGYVVEGGGFKHLADGKRDGMATEQGYYALVAYFRLKDGKTSLYDMSDVTIQKGNQEDPTKPTDPAKPTDPSKPTDPVAPTDPKKPTNSNQKPGSPATGDNSPIGLYTVTLILGLVAAAVLLAPKMKKKRAQK